MKSWRRSEPREFRPFFQAWDLEDALNAAQLVVAGEEVDSATDVVPLDAERFRDLEVGLRPNVDAEALADRLGARANSIALVVTIRDPMLKRRVLREKWNFSGGLLEEYCLGSDLVEKFGHGRELQVTLALALDEDLDVEPGWPHIRGQWFSKRRFIIKLRSIQSISSVEPMSPELALKLTGSRGALVGVDYYDGQLEIEAEEGTHIAKCYVAEDVYKAMHASKSPIQKFM